VVSLHSLDAGNLYLTLGYTQRYWKVGILHKNKRSILQEKVMVCQEHVLEYYIKIREAFYKRKWWSAKNMSKESDPFFTLIMVMDFHHIALSKDVNLTLKKARHYPRHIWQTSLDINNYLAIRIHRYSRYQEKDSPVSW